jgi:large subunit ribosomal protein L10
LKKSDKELLVQELTEKISKMSALFLASYKGMTYEELSNVRNSIKSDGDDFRVVKNRLLKIALQNNNIEGLDEYLVEPTACAIVFGDPASVAKKFKKFAKDFKQFDIKAGFFENTPLAKEDVIALADLPSREELLAKMLGSLTAPARNFVSLLANIPRSLLNVLNAIKEKKENN